MSKSIKHPDEFLERIRQTEYDDLDRISRFLHDVTIETTAKFEGPKRVRKDCTEKTFKPDFIFKYVVLTFLVGLLFILIRETLSGTQNSITGLVFTYCFVIFLIFATVKQFYFDRKLNYTIRIDHTGISIDKTLFAWRDIYDTAILTMPGGRTNTYYLVIALNNKTTYEKFNLSHFIRPGFWGFGSTLAKYIEYFKPGTSSV